MHMVNLVKGQSIVQHASENGWKHLRLDFIRYKGYVERTFRF